MKIIVGKIQSTKKEGSNKNSFFRDGRKVHPKERRKKKQDQRQNVRDGVIVSLSFKNDRRISADRRKANLHKNPYTV